MVRDIYLVGKSRYNKDLCKKLTWLDLVFSNKADGSELKWGTGVKKALKYYRWKGPKLLHLRWGKYGCLEKILKVKLKQFGEELNVEIEKNHLLPEVSSLRSGDSNLYGEMWDVG